MAKIFICYRRDDSIETAGRIYSWLDMRLPRGTVFFDVRSLLPGQNFRAAIERELTENIAVVLVVIGKAWAFTVSANGSVHNRLHDDDDNVRREIELALALGKPTAPVLVQGTTMPVRTLLPNSIAELADLNALRVRPEPDFDDDMRRLRAALVNLNVGLAFHDAAPPPSMGRQAPYAPPRLNEFPEWLKKELIIEEISQASPDVDLSSLIARYYPGTDTWKDGNLSRPPLPQAESSQSDNHTIRRRPGIIARLLRRPIDQ